MTNEEVSYIFDMSIPENIADDIAAGDPTLYLAPLLDCLPEMKQFTDELPASSNPD